MTLIEAALRVAGGDPWAVIGEVTGYRHFRRPREDRYPIIFQLVSEDAGAGLGALRATSGWDIPSVYAADASAFARSQAFATATLDRPAYEALLRGDAKPVRTWSLQLPVVPGRPRPAEFMPIGTRPSSLGAGAVDHWPKSSALFGVIDSGCPFARVDLLRNGCTRVVALWDQDSRPVLSSASVPEPERATTPPSLGYGGEVSGGQLDAWRRRFADSGDAVDEAACYRAAGYRLLDQQFQHGAAVLSLLAGPSTVAQRHPADPDRPPQWRTTKVEPAARADIVFVQLACDSVQDSSSASLPRSLLDGLRYIVSVARQRACHRIVVNISGGTSRCAHDGRSIIELAMLALIDDLAHQRPAVKLDLALAAGNAFAEMRHAQLSVDARQPASAVTLRLPPGSETPAFVTVAVPADACDLQLAIVPPGHATMAEPWIDVGAGSAGTLRCWPDSTRPVAWAAALPPQPDDARIVALCWAPTAACEARDAVAPAGDWVIRLRRKPDSQGSRPVTVQLWISRGQTNPGALDRAIQAHFVDTDGSYDPGRPLRRCEDDPVPPRSPIRRHGTLNGLATMAPRQGVTVVGSHIIREDRPSLYSSDGPVPGRAQGPDCLRPTDAARTLDGVRTSGVFSGSVVRVMGTSFAAPQRAREIMNGSATSATGLQPEPVRSRARP